MSIWKLGIIKLNPKNKRIIPAITRRVFDGMPVSRTIIVRKSVKKVKLKINPRIIPKGRFLSPLTLARTIGRIGRIQGDRIVTMPAKNANKNKIIIRIQL